MWRCTTITTIVINKLVGLVWVIENLESRGILKFQESREMLIGLWKIMENWYNFE